MRRLVFIFASLLLLAAVADAQVANEIVAVAPDTASAGVTGLVVTMTLDTDAPPAPPADVLPQSVMIGSHAGTQIAHPSSYVVTASFDLPADVTPGPQDVAVTFQTPSGTLVFGADAAFTILEGGDLPPAISGEPQPVTTIPGGVATFTVTASGTPPLHHQWQKDGADLAGADGATLTLSPVQWSDAGDYRCRVSNDVGEATSQVAALTVSTTLIGAHPIVDTGQDLCYDTAQAITCPAPGEDFHGQDSQHVGHAPSFTLSGDGLSIHDDVTGLDWQRSADVDGDGVIDAGDKLTWSELQIYPATLNAENFGGHDDWRLPSIKELYSLIDFRGVDPSGDASVLVPFLDTAYFTFAYGDTLAGERVIDAQYASSTLYVSQVSGTLLFGVNFADGRIKGYGLTIMGQDKTFYVKCVRGQPLYAASAYVDGGDGTITDRATGLMWSQQDSGEGMTWQDALAWVDARNAEGWLGHDDWRLPDAKELQSLVDYTRAPDTSSSAAIDPIFACTDLTNEAGQPDYPYYWASTTHVAGGPVPGGFAVYVAFGRALGYLDGAWRDVHGAGAQRSDPKQGDPADYPFGHGPQGDAIRIFNFVRLVRDAEPQGSGSDDVPPARLGLRAAPNPFNPAVTLSFDVPLASPVTLRILDVRGHLVATLMAQRLAAGPQEGTWDGTDRRGLAMPSGVYLAQLVVGSRESTVKILLAR